MAARGISTIRNSLVLVIRTTSFGTPLVAVESARRIVGHAELWRNSPTTDLRHANQLRNNGTKPKRLGTYQVTAELVAVDFLDFSSPRSTTGRTSGMTSCTALLVVSMYVMQTVIDGVEPALIPTVKAAAIVPDTLATVRVWTTILLKLHAVSL